MTSRASLPTIPAIMVTARLGDVFYDGAAARADPMIDQCRPDGRQGHVPPVELEG